MRLVCPNCGAQYEVDDRVIPDSGRDVQCSSCGHAWYQMPAHVEAAEDPAPTEAFAEADDETGAGFEAESAPEVAPEPEETGDAIAVDEPAAEPAADVTEAQTAERPAPSRAAGDEDEDGEEEHAGATPPAAGTPPRRELDQSLRAILQEEVAREMEARAAAREPDAVGTRADHAPTAPGRPEASPVFDDAAASDFDDDALPDISLEDETGADHRAQDAAAAAAAHASRRDLFPDIEEINSTLDRHGLPDEEFDDETEEPRGGFSRGFFAIIFIAALGLALYLVAPQLAHSVPALEPALGAYVTAVNGARAWLDTLLQGATDRMGGAGQP